MRIFGVVIGSTDASDRYRRRTCHRSQLEGWIDREQRERLSDEDYRHMA